MIDRVTYSDIRSMILETYWRACRDHAFSGWSQEQVCAWVYGEFEGSFDLEVEVFMLEVASLILSGGWSVNLVAHHTSEISKILSNYSIGDLLRGVPSEESDELKADLVSIGWK